MAEVSELRRKVVEAARTLVVKVGTSVLSRGDDSLDDARFADLAAQLHRARETVAKWCLFPAALSARGWACSDSPNVPTTCPPCKPPPPSARHTSFAAATTKRCAPTACGPRSASHRQRLPVAHQIPQRPQHAARAVRLQRATDHQRERHTVSIQEIKFGDNDRLAALVSHLLESPLLAILSVIDGLYDGDPKLPTSRVIPLVDEWSESLRGWPPTTKANAAPAACTKLDAARPPRPSA